MLLLSCISTPSHFLLDYHTPQSRFIQAKGAPQYHKSASATHLLPRPAPPPPSHARCTTKNFPTLKYSLFQASSHASSSNETGDNHACILCGLMVTRRLLLLAIAAWACKSLSHIPPRPPSLAPQTQQAPPRTYVPRCCSTPRPCRCPWSRPTPRQWRPQRHRSSRRCCCERRSCTAYGKWPRPRCCWPWPGHGGLCGTKEGGQRACQDWVSGLVVVV